MSSDEGDEFATNDQQPVFRKIPGLRSVGGPSPSRRSTGLLPRHDAWQLWRATLRDARAARAVPLPLRPHGDPARLDHARLDAESTTGRGEPEPAISSDTASSPGRSKPSLISSRPAGTSTSTPSTRSSPETSRAGAGPATARLSVWNILVHSTTSRACSSSSARPRTVPAARIGGSSRTGSSAKAVADGRTTVTNRARDSIAG